MGTSYTVRPSNELLQILNDREADSSDGIITGDEPWFHYLYESLTMFTKSPGDLIPRTRNKIGVKKTMFTVCFTNKKLLIAEYLPKGQKSIQDYSISDILSELEQEKMRYKRRKHGGTDYVHMDRSKSHNDGKIQEKFDGKGRVRCPHSPSSPDLSPRGFWSFGMAKEKMRDREFRTVQDILRTLRGSGMISLLKTPNLYSLSGRSA
jgi:hypothetical protein